MSKIWFLLGLFLLTLYTEECKGANILLLSPFSSSSHKTFFMPIVNELARRGHTITVWTSQKPKGKVDNVRELYAEEPTKIMEKSMEFDKDYKNPLMTFPFMLHYTLTLCNATYRAREFQDMLTAKDKYDLIMINSLFNDCMLPLVHHYNAPFLYISTGIPFPWIVEAVGSPLSLDHVPAAITRFTDNMNIWQRLGNTLITLYLTNFRNYFMLPSYKELASQYLGNLPSLKDIENNVSLVLTNTHLSMNYQSPKPPAIVEVGNVHCVPSKPLPQDLEEFITGAGDAGFILLSFGSVLRGANIPVETRNVFISTFARLQQRVLWKWEDEKGIPNLPKNIKLSPWLPQQDLLGHPKIKLFISHGGLLSNQEAVYHGVPLIGLPVYGDQHLNMIKAQNDGYAIQLNWAELTEDALYEAIQKIITDSSYSKNVRHLSTLAKDVIIPPLEQAVHAVEYVIRHKGAPHLKTAARNLAPYQRGLLDVMFVIACIIFTIIYFVYKILQFIVRKCKKLTSPKKSTVEKKKKKK